MGHFYSTIFLISLSLSFISLAPKPSILVNANKALESQVCSKTPFPSECKDCFNSRPHRSKTDLRDLGGLTIACALDQRANVTKKIIAYAENATDERLKQGCKNCVHFFDMMQSSLTTAYNSWNSKLYGLARNSVDDGRTELSACWKEIPREVCPPDFWSSIDKLGRLIGVAENVMERLS